MDPSGYLSKFVAWLISGLAIIGGIFLCATGTYSVFGGMLIAGGVESLINGYMTEANGGDFTAGYIGGFIAGGLSGAGAGLGGEAFFKASEVSNFASIGYLMLGIGVSYTGGFVGNLLGTIYTSWHNSDFKKVDIDWEETLAMSTFIGTLNILAGFGSSMSTISSTTGALANDLNSKIASWIVTGLIIGGVEIVYDLISYLIDKLISALNY